MLFTVAVVYLPSMQQIFETARLDAWMAALIAPCGLVVWGADELWRWRRRADQPAAAAR